LIVSDNNKFLKLTKTKWINKIKNKMIIKVNIWPHLIQIIKLMITELDLAQVDNYNKIITFLITKSNKIIFINKISFLVQN